MRKIFVRSSTDFFYFFLYYIFHVFNRFIKDKLNTKRKGAVNENDFGGFSLSFSPYLSCIFTKQILYAIGWRSGKMVGTNINTNTTLGGRSMEKLNFLQF